MGLARVLTCVFIFLFRVLPAGEPTPNATIMIPMRDGTELPTDIYLPSPTATNLPCILVRSPAGRNADFAKAHAALVHCDYIVAIQDTRSALDPEGKTLPYWSDAWGFHQDGYDTVQWLANSPYSNGNIGTAGMSALGITQLLMAPTSPEGLKCQYIGVAAGSLYHHAIFPGGKLLKNQVEGWLGLYAKDPNVLSFVCNQCTYNNFWSQFDAAIVADRVTVPAIHHGGWYDTFLQGTIDSFATRQEKGGEGAKGTQKLLIGPWTHLWPKSQKLGDFDVPKSGYTPPVDISMPRWFDFHLKGKQNDMDAIPPVTYYVMGTFDGSPSSGNVWRHADVWPVPSLATPFYLDAENGLLENSLPSEARTYTYEYDPANPVPTIGGRNLFLESGPKDQKTLEQRHDVVSFTTAPLLNDLEVTGRIFAKLYASSEDKESDIAVRLTDVYPDGRSILIADGLAHRVAADIDDPKKPQEILVDLWSTSIVFAKGHRIRISISASNYPKFEKHDALHPKAKASKQHLFIGKNTPSQIILPLVRRGELALVKQPN